MRGTMRAAGLALAMLGLLPALAAEGAPDVEAVKKTAREYVRLFYAADLKPIHEKFTDQMKEAMPFEAFQEVRRMVGLQLGDETELVSEDVEVRDNYLVYTRTARFEKYKGEVESQWVMRDGGIAGVQFRPAAPAAGAGDSQD